jgi:hypothetical protein
MITIHNRTDRIIELIETKCDNPDHSYRLLIDHLDIGVCCNNKNAIVVIEEERDEGILYIENYLEEDPSKRNYFTVKLIDNKWHTCLA